MKDVAGREKHYVEVISRTTPEGQIWPLKIIWDDGRRFEIDRVLDCRRAASLKCGGTGMRYTIMVCGQPTYLFLERQRWFVEAKVAPMP